MESVFGLYLHVIFRYPKSSILASNDTVERLTALQNVQKLSESMNVEMAPKGIHVQCQVPLLVATKLSKIRRAKWDSPSPATYAKAGVAAIGYAPVVSPYWAHKLQLWVMSIVPGSANFVFGMHKSIRARALKKLSTKIE